MPRSLVSVVIPAFNAARTVDATLRSARGQTHRHLEILVVDDGSTDGTARLVEAHVAQDSRIRLIGQANGGVARARNRGIDEAAGEFVAPLDGDDLWHPEKIARQLQALEDAGPKAALAYNWYRRIDMRDDVLPISPYPVVTGSVLHRHIDWNFISNGSTPLIRADVARRVRYEPALHDAGNQGCEDYLFQLRIAARHQFACVPAFLTGYRRIPGAMSSSIERMIRSHLHMYAMLAGEVDAPARRLIRRRRAILMIELARTTLGKGGVGPAFATALRAAAENPAAAAGAVIDEVQKRVARSPHGSPARPFQSYAPDERDGTWQTSRSGRWLRHLAALDAEARG